LKHVAGEKDLVAGGVEAKASGPVTGNQTLFTDGLLRAMSR
jgi:hypothetical protein